MVLYKIDRIQNRIDIPYIYPLGLLNIRHILSSSNFLGINSFTPNFEAVGLGRNEVADTGAVPISKSVSGKQTYRLISLEEEIHKLEWIQLWFI